MRYGFGGIVGVYGRHGTWRFDLRIGGRTHLILRYPSALYELPGYTTATVSRRTIIYVPQYYSSLRECRCMLHCRFLLFHTWSILQVAICLRCLRPRLFNLLSGGLLSLCFPSLLQSPLLRCNNLSRMSTMLLGPFPHLLPALRALPSNPLLLLRQPHIRHGILQTRNLIAHLPRQLQPLRARYPTFARCPDVLEQALLDADFHALVFCENRRAVFDRCTEGCNDGGYNVADVLRGAPARRDADDVAFDKGVVWISYQVGCWRGKMLQTWSAIITHSLKGSNCGVEGQIGSSYFSELFVPFLPCYANFNSAFHPPC
jgi:hypothetical protein